MMCAILSVDVFEARIVFSGQMESHSRNSFCMSTNQRSRANITWSFLTDRSTRGPIADESRENHNNIERSTETEEILHASVNYELTESAVSLIYLISDSATSWNIRR